MRVLSHRVAGCLAASVLALILGLSLPSTACAQDAWLSLRPGLEIRFMEAGSVRVGSPRLAVLRADPNQVRFRVLAAPPDHEGYTANQWRRSSGALAVFNAGQYAADRSYLGLLIHDGQQRGRLMGHLEAMFLADPTEPGLPPVRVVDLHYTPFSASSIPYRQAAQSLMLLDRFGAIRARRTEKLAHRTLVAQDGQDRVLVMVTEGRHTLWELARFISEAGLGLREVMCMDGGPEAQLDVKVGDYSYGQSGGPTSSPSLPLPWPTANLPAALAIFPK